MFKGYTQAKDMESGKTTKFYKVSMVKVGRTVYAMYDPKEINTINDIEFIKGQMVDFLKNAQKENIIDKGICWYGINKYVKVDANTNINEHLVEKNFSK